MPAIERAAASPDSLDSGRNAAAPIAVPYGASEARMGRSPLGSIAAGHLRHVMPRRSRDALPEGIVLPARAAAADSRRVPQVPQRHGAFAAPEHLRPVADDVATE